MSFGVVVGAFSCAGMEGGVLLLGLFPPRTQTENRGTPLSTISAGALWIGYNVLDGLVRRIAADQPHAGTRARRDVALRDRFNPSLSRPSSTRPSNALDSEPSRAVFFTYAKSRQTHFVLSNQSSSRPSPFLYGLIFS